MGPRDPTEAVPHPMAGVPPRGGPRPPPPPTPVKPHAAPKRTASGTGRPKPSFRKTRAAADADRGRLRRAFRIRGVGILTALRFPPLRYAPTSPREAERCGGGTAAPGRRNPAADAGNFHYGMCRRHGIRRRTDPAHRASDVTPGPPIRQRCAPITHKPHAAFRVSHPTT